MPENNDEQKYSYGKSFFKTIFFSITSATLGAISALPSLSFKGIIDASLDSGTAGLLVGGTMMSILAIMKKEPRVNLKVVIPALITSIVIAQNYLADEESDIYEIETFRH
jgi:hypothetical protein